MEPLEVQSALEEGHNQESASEPEAAVSAQEAIDLISEQPPAPDENMSPRVAARPPGVRASTNG